MGGGLSVHDGSISGMRYAEAKKGDTAVHTYTCPCNENTTRFSQLRVCASVRLRMHGVHVGFKRYDMFCGLVFRESVWKRITHSDPAPRFGTAARNPEKEKKKKNPPIIHDDGVARLSGDLWPECTQGNARYVLRSSRRCLLNVEE